MSDDITTLATVLYEVVGELGARHLLPTEFISEWLGKLHPMCSKYDCAGCGKPIRFNEEALGSDVFCVYAHARCEKDALHNWKLKHPTPPVPELKAADLGGSDG